MKNKDEIVAIRDRNETLHSFAHKESAAGRVDLEKFLKYQPLKSSADALSAIVDGNKSAIDFFKLSGAVHVNSNIARSMMSIFEAATKSAVVSADWMAFELIYQAMNTTDAILMAHTEKQFELYPYVCLAGLLRNWSISGDTRVPYQQKSEFQIKIESAIFGLVKRHEGLGKNYAEMFSVSVGRTYAWDFVGKAGFTSFWNGDIRAAYERVDLLSTVSEMTQQVMKSSKPGAL